MRATWQTSRFLLNLAAPQVMGIVNITPDSFSDGGRLVDSRSAIQHCEKLLSEGAHILDLGGESSRPGAQPVTVAVELGRLLPVLDAALTLGCPISVDTTKPEVMQRALDLGADIINDINALRADGAVAAVAGHGACGVCLMHMQGEPHSMQLSPTYADVVAEVRQFLEDRAEKLMQAGVSRARIALDPGIGFGKTLDDNFELLNRQSELLSFGFPILAGWSRKSALGHVTGRAVAHRTAASVAAALAAVHRGARIVRVHDVAETVDALKVWAAAGLLQAPQPMYSDPHAQPEAG